MKIALIGTAHPYRGGLASYNERLARQFMEEGHDVTVYTFSLQYPSFLFPGKTQYSEEPAPAGLRIVRSIHSVNPFNWFRVGRRIRKAAPDLVVIKFWLPFMGPCFGTILRRIKRNGKSRVVCIVDNMIPHESRPGDRSFTKYFIRPVDAFIAMSESVLQEIGSFDASKPKALSPHPLFDNFGPRMERTAALESLGLSPEFHYVLFFGLIRKYKGLDWLLEAFADQRFREMPLKLIVAGEYYSDKEAYAAIIAQHGLGEHVIETNAFIADSQVKAYFSAADLVVQPYKSATQSGVTQIAYHFNTPMIVTDVGGLAELCPDGKVGYVVSTNPADIADAMVRFYSEGKQEEFERNIAEEKKKYAWNVMTRCVMRLYENLQ